MGFPFRLELLSSCCYATTTTTARAAKKLLTVWWSQLKRVSAADRYPVTAARMENCSHHFTLHITSACIPVSSVHWVSLILFTWANIIRDVQPVQHGIPSFLKSWERSSPKNYFNSEKYQRTLCESNKGGILFARVEGHDVDVQNSYT